MRPWQILRLCCLLVTTAALAACATLPSTLPKNPPFITPKGLSTPTALHNGHWPQADWWQALHAAGLNRWMQRALAQNPGLQAAGARVLAAEAATAGAQARLFPHFNAGFALTQQYFSAHGLHLAANGTSNVFTQINPVQIGYHVDLWGRDRDLVAAARGDAAMARAEEAQTRLLLSTAVALHYVAWRGDLGLLQIEVRLRTLQQQSLHVATGAYDSGVANAAAMLANRQDLAQTVARVAALRAAAATEQHALTELAGAGPAGDPVPRGRPFTLPALESRMPARLPLGLLARRPDIVAARWGVEAAAARVHAARAAFYPDVNLRLLAGWNSIDLGDLFRPGSFAHALGPVITLPIFEGGALRAHLRGENAVFLAAQDAYRGQILAALRQVADLLSAWQRLRTQSSAAKQVQVAARQQRKLADGAWQSGLQSRSPSLQARIACVQSEAALLRLRVARLQNWVLLASALGGGFQEQVRPDEEGRLR